MGLVVDNSGAIFDDRRKKQRRKINKNVEIDNRKVDRRKENKKNA